MSDTNEAPVLPDVSTETLFVINDLFTALARALKREILRDLPIPAELAERVGTIELAMMQHLEKHSEEHYVTAGELTAIDERLSGELTAIDERLYGVEWQLSPVDLEKMERDLNEATDAIEEMRDLISGYPEVSVRNALAKALRSAADTV